MVPHDSAQTHTIPHGFGADSSEETEQAIEAGNAALAIESLKASTKRCYNAGQIEARHPQLYQVICALLAAGMPAHTIAGIADMDTRTVLALHARADAQGVIPSFRETYITQLRGLMSIGSAELLERFKAGKVTALDLKLLCDQHELLSGNATVIVRTVEDPDIAQMRSEHQQQLARRLEQAQTALSDRVKIESYKHERLALDGSNRLDDLPAQRVEDDEERVNVAPDASKPAAKSPKRRSAKPPVITLDSAPVADRSPSDSV